MSELEQKEPVEVRLLTEAGLGYGEGLISPAEHMKNGKFDRESLRAAVDILLHDESVYVGIDPEAADDGCGDGRWAIKIYKLLDPATKKTAIYKRSLTRAKIFGGGLVAAASMWRAVDGSPGGKTLRGDRKFIAGKLKESGITYGAHTDDHAHGDNCGCGAIDKYGIVSANVVKYRSNIVASLAVLYGDEFEDNADAIADAMGVYDHLDDAYYGILSGRQAMDDIEKDGAVVKQLEGEHLEGTILINKVEGTTLDQQKLRDTLSERGYSPNVQAFVVDEWRGRMYADAVADIVLEQDGSRNRDEAYRVAYADFLIRTLAVGATLTKGDLPVLVREAKSAYAHTA